MAAPSLPDLPAPGGSVLSRSDLLVRHSPPYPDEQRASVPRELDQRSWHGCRNRRHHAPAPADPGAAPRPAWLRANDPARFIDGRVVVLYPASVREYLLVSRGGLGFPCRRAGGQLFLRPAADFALADRLHRLPPHPSSLQQGAQLSSDCVLRAECTVPAGQAPQPARQLEMSAARIVGRGEMRAGRVPRCRRPGGARAGGYRTSPSNALPVDMSLRCTSFRLAWRSISALSSAPISVT